MLRKDGPLLCLTTSLVYSYFLSYIYISSNLNIYVHLEFIALYFTNIYYLGQIYVHIYIYMAVYFVLITSFISFYGTRYNQRLDHNLTMGFNIMVRDLCPE
jgi:hypothetical protein